MTWGWMVASFFTMIVALSMAEICSAYPTSGGLYYWAAALGNKRYGTMASWFAGWFNLLGQIAITAGVGMACTNSIVAMAVMYGSPARANRHGGISLASFSAFLPNSRGSPGPLLQAEPCPYDADYNLLTSAVMQTYITAGTYPTDAFGKNFTYAETAFNDAECARMPINFTQPQIYAIYVGVIFLVAVLNSASVKGLNGIVLFSIFWHVVGSLVIIIGLPSIVKVYQSRHMIWGYWQPFNQVDADGVTGFPQTLCTTASTKASIVASSEFASASYGPNNWMAGCPLYGTQAAPKGRTIFQTNLNGVFVANGAINWGYNGINKYSLGLKSGSKSTPEKDGPVNAYIWFCGLLMSQWCYTGYDASAHMSEETKNAAVNGPRGIITTIVATFAFGLSYIVSILASITDYNNSTGGPFALSYNPAAQIFWCARVRPSAS